LGTSLFISYLLQNRSKEIRILGAAALLAMALFHFKASYFEYGLDTTIDWQSVSDHVAKDTTPIYIGDNDYEMTPLTSYYLPQSGEKLIVIKNSDDLNQINLDQQNVFIFQNYSQTGSEETLNQAPFCIKNTCQFFFL
jgi:hypothetical protein